MLDPVLLESFLAVAQARSFSEAGRRLGLRQSTISQHIRKLEQAAGRRLFVRDTHSVAATADGEAMEGFAVLRACELAGVPAVEIRVIANEIDEPDRTRWRFDDAFAALVELMPRLVAVASAA